jgi:hypothetical protein
MTKRCIKCGQIKLLECFSKERTRVSGLRPYCKECDKLHYLAGGHEKSKNWAKQNPDKTKAWRRKFYLKNHEKMKEISREHRRRVNMEAYKVYGGAFCACCGETIIGFLTIDHINGVTREERKIQTKGRNVCQWLKNKGYPPGYQVLCFNCNLGRAKNKGVCPHKMLP